jgi:hypothetical protein
VSLLGAGAALVVVLVSAGGVARDRRRDRHDGGGEGVERATACAGEWSPVSGIR